jgi:ABC-type protease/lipase transport system fused ATPase/permease subunit
MRNLPQSMAAKSAFTGARQESETNSPQNFYQGWRSAHQSIRFNRVRVVLTIISLAFLSLFLFVIYLQFGIIVFIISVTVMTLISVAFILYCKKVMKNEEDGLQNE